MLIHKNNGCKIFFMLCIETLFKLHKKNDEDHWNRTPIKIQAKEGSKHLICTYKNSQIAHWKITGYTKSDATTKGGSLKRRDGHTDRPMNRHTVALIHDTHPTFVLP